MRLNPEFLDTSMLGMTSSTALGLPGNQYDPDMFDGKITARSDESEWIPPPATATAPVPVIDAEGAAAATEHAESGEVMLTSRTALRTQTAAEGVIETLRASAHASELAVGSYPKGEVGLAPLADQLEKHRTVALKLNPARNDVFTASNGCEAIVAGLKEAEALAAKLESSKVKAANTEEAEIHEAQKNTAREAAAAIEKLVEQMKQASAVEADGLSDILREATLEEEATELDRLRGIVLGAPSRQELEGSMPDCMALAENLRGKEREEDAAQVDALCKQMKQDAPEARVALSEGMDFISGFHIMDGQDRVVVLEGLHQGGLREKVLKVCPKAKAGELFPYTLLYNNRVSFKERLYAYLAHDVRYTGGILTIRLDGGDEYGGALPLERLLFSKESTASKHLYYRGDPRTQNRVKFGEPPPVVVDELGYAGLNIIAQLLRQPRMWDISALKLFPEKPHLDALLEHFSVESLSDADELGPENTEDTTVKFETSGDIGATREIVRRKAATDHSNPTFLKAKARWKAPNHITQNIDKMKPLEPPLKGDKWWENETRPVFVYSGQRLQYTEWQKEQIRESAKADPDNHYTYSQQFLSGSLCPVNEDYVQQQNEAAHRAKFMSEEGFIYPRPKEPQEYYSHPLAISENRAEELRIPYEAPSKASEARGTTVSDDEVPPSLHGRPQFNQTPCFSGYIEKDTYNAWRSVHLANDNRDHQTQLKEKEMAHWRQKMVVEDAATHVYRGGMMRGRVGQLDRREEILKDKPKKAAIKHMPHRPEVPPMNIEQEYPEKKGRGGLLARITEPDKWVSKDDFQTLVDSRHKPYYRKPNQGEKSGGLLQIKQTVTKIHPLATEDKCGPFWQGSRRASR